VCAVGTKVNIAVVAILGPVFFFFFLFSFMKYKERKRKLSILQMTAYAPGTQRGREGGGIISNR
jgi:hypothetical protein